MGKRKREGKRKMARGKAKGRQGKREKGKGKGREGLIFFPRERQKIKWGRKGR